MRVAVLLTVFTSFVSLASADLYDVTINTSSIAGTLGSLDFNFDPGPLVTQPASLQILNFASDGSLVTCAVNVQGFCSTGDVSGQLPGALTFDNAAGFNDYFDDFTFGSTIYFQASLYGPALSSPDGVSTSGSAFAFSMFADIAGTIPVLTSDTTAGFAFTADVGLDGTTTVTDFSTQASVVPAIVSTPEPSGTCLILIEICSFLGLSIYKHKRILSVNGGRSGPSWPSRSESHSA